MWIRRASTALGLLVLAALAPPFRAAGAATAPPGFIVENLLPGTSFDDPVQILFLPDGRMFVIELDGRVRVVLSDGTQLGPYFIDLRDEVGQQHDLGLLGAALDPDYVDDPWLYLAYTVDPGGDGDDSNDQDRFIRVTRYKAAAGDPNVADPATRQALIGATWPEGPPSLSLSHTVGILQFGEDGSLLCAVGDGGHFKWVDAGGNDPGGFGPGRTNPSEDLGAFRARTVNSLSGSILRFDKDTGLGLPSNPFWNGSGGAFRSKIWLYGLRNPYRFSVRPGSGGEAAGGPGTLYIGDVGWGSFEEFLIAKEGGLNFGWPCREGPDPQWSYIDVTETEVGNDNVLCDAGLNVDNPAPDVDPVFWWHHEAGEASYPEGWVGRAATGGDFYTGQLYPEPYRGAYFLADFTFGWIRRIEVDADDNVTGWADFIEEAEGPVHITTDPVTKDLVYIALWAKEVRRIRYGSESSAGEPPEAAALSLQSMPNPFRRTTLLRFTLPEAKAVTLRVLDAAGRVVASPVESRGYGPGAHVVEWDGAGPDGRRVERGVYFARLRAGERVISEKIVHR